MTGMAYCAKMTVTVETMTNAISVQTMVEVASATFPCRNSTATSGKDKSIAIARSCTANIPARCCNSIARRGEKRLQEKRFREKRRGYKRR